MQLGKVKFFDTRGFGFIQPCDGSEDVYFHVSELPGERGKRSISDGQAVSFELGTYKGKTVAKTVRPLLLEDGGAQ
jgi:cold shock protein